jgi:8-oxo-dGTP diphosphatase
MWNKMGFFSTLYGFLKNKHPTVGVPIIIIKDNKILLGKRSRDSIFYIGYWGLPGGILNYGEKMQQAAKRELKEELGVEAEVIKTGKTYERLPNKECKMHGIDIVHYCKLKGEPKPKDETKEIKWFKPEQIRKMNLAYIHKEILIKEGVI